MSAKEKINHAHGRNTNDYTPTMPGGKEEMTAINARREMLNVLALPRNPGKPQRKNHFAKVVISFTSDVVLYICRLSIVCFLKERKLKKFFYE